MRSRFLIVGALLLFAAVTLYLRPDVDRTPAALSLVDLPRAFGPWVSTDIAIDPAVLRVLGDGHFLNRIYYEPAHTRDNARPAQTVSLFIGYFPTQRTGQSIHSPQNCLPGAGWTFESAGRTTLTDGAGRAYEVGDYVITDGRTRQEVLYWYRAHGRTVANDYLAKLYLLADAIRFNRTDGALIRVVTPVQAGESSQQVHERLVSFASITAPLLPSFIPN